MKTVVILSDQKLHLRQGAAYSRMINYAKALTLNKDVKVYLCSFQLSKDLSSHQEIFESIYIIGKPRILSDYKYSKYYEKLLNPFRSLSYFSKTRKYFNEKQIAWIIFPKRFFNDVFTLFVVKYLQRQKIYCEKNELKIGILLNTSFPQGMLKKLLFLMMYPFWVLDAKLNDYMVRYYDGVIAISTNMNIWLQKKNRNIVKIPILVDCSVYNFDKIIGKSKQFSIGFIGSISCKKEGLINLIIAISKIDNVVLNIYGAGSKTDMNKLQNIISEYRIDKKVIFHGQKDVKLIPSILAEQSLLILTRPNNIQNKYGFSTKLAEYMASGVPVLVTDVSDNALYIKDGENGFIISSNNPELLAEKLKEIIDRSDSNEIGLRGRRTAMVNFDYRIYSVKLYNFLFEK